MPAGETRSGRGARRRSKTAAAWCLTVHKSQGSEYERVLMVLADNPKGRVLTRELLYTGVTRTKKRVDVWGSDGAIARCVGNPRKRRSGWGDTAAGACEGGGVC